MQIIPINLLFLVGLFCGGFLIYNDAKTLKKGFHETSKSKHPVILGRVSKGIPTNIWNVSHVVAVIIKIKLRFKAAANIISKFWAVSSASALMSLSRSVVVAELAYVRGNTSRWRGNHGFYVDHLILDCIIHDQYIADQYDNDIALVKVKKPFNAQHENPIQIAPPNYQYKGGTGAIVTGWGASTGDNIAEPNDVLLSAPIKLKNPMSCKVTYPKLTDRMVCATANGRGACVYDSGGPLEQNNFIIGIVAYRQGCDVQSDPGIFIKLSEYYNWIMKITNHLH